MLLTAIQPGPGHMMYFILFLLAGDCEYNF